jgi:hypothetical protein
MSSNRIKGSDHFESAAECIEAVRNTSVYNWAPGARDAEVSMAQVHATLAAAAELRAVVAELRALREAVAEVQWPPHEAGDGNPADL